MVTLNITIKILIENCRCRKSRVCVVSMYPVLCVECRVSWIMYLVSWSCIMYFDPVFCSCPLSLKLCLVTSRLPWSVSCFWCPISCILYPVSRVLWPISCFLYIVSVSCDLYPYSLLHVSYTLCPISCILRSKSCIACLVSLNLYPVSCITLWRVTEGEELSNWLGRILCGTAAKLTTSIEWRDGEIETNG
jgi:hypothetical protein